MPRSKLEGETINFNLECPTDEWVEFKTKAREEWPKDQNLVSVIVNLIMLYNGPRGKP